MSREWSAEARAERYPGFEAFKDALAALIRAQGGSVTFEQIYQHLGEPQRTKRQLVSVYNRLAKLGRAGFVQTTGNVRARLWCLGRGVRTPAACANLEPKPLSSTQVHRQKPVPRPAPYAGTVVVMRVPSNWFAAVPYVPERFDAPRPGSLAFMDIPSVGDRC